MKLINFTYDNSKNDPKPSVLVTSENQHMIQGFNTNYMTKGQATLIQNQWGKIKNQRWSNATKVRVLMSRVGAPAKRSYRMYRTEGVAYSG